MLPCFDWLPNAATHKVNTDRGNANCPVNSFKGCQSSGFWFSLVYFFQLGKSWCFETTFLNLLRALPPPVALPSPPPI